jgi:hypothetical protein
VHHQRRKNNKRMVHYRYCLRCQSKKGGCVNPCTEAPTIVYQLEPVVKPSQSANKSNRLWILTIGQEANWNNQLWILTMGYQLEPVTKFIQCVLWWYSTEEQHFAVCKKNTTKAPHVSTHEKTYTANELFAVFCLLWHTANIYDNIVTNWKLDNSTSRIILGLSDPRIYIE